MWKDFQEYFKLYLSITDCLNIDGFKEWFFLVKHINMDENQALEYKEIINQVQSISLDGLNCSQIITAFEQQQFYTN